MRSALDFDIDYQQLYEVGTELEASEKQVRYALSYALRRTATTLRTMAARALRDELQLRALNVLRRRLKALKVRFNRTNGMQLWFGLNDMPVSWFKGTPKKVAGGAQVRDHKVDGGFVAKSKFKGRKTIFKRVGTARLPVAEQNVPIEDRAVVLVEDQIFDKTEEIFWQYFERDLRARVTYNVGRGS